MLLRDGFVRELGHYAIRETSERESPITRTGVKQIDEAGSLSHAKRECQFGLMKVRFRGLDKNMAHVLTLFALSNLWAPLCDVRFQKTARDRTLHRPPSDWPLESLTMNCQLASLLLLAAIGIRTSESRTTPARTLPRASTIRIRTCRRPSQLR